jgi:hypothetical protein
MQGRSGRAEIPVTQPFFNPCESNQPLAEKSIALSELDRKSDTSRTDGKASQAVDAGNRFFG